MVDLSLIDLGRFRKQLEMSCEKALGHALIHRNEAGYERAQGLLDGILNGVLDLASAVAGKFPWELLFMDIAREVTEKAGRELMRMRSEGL